MVLLRTRQSSHSSSSAPSSPRVGDLAEPGSDGPGFAGDPFVPFRLRSSMNATIATAATGIAMPRTIPSGNGAVGGVESPRERCPTFFFQAEDGIRDVAVTGVQTCALPI